MDTLKNARLEFSEHRPAAAVELRDGTLAPVASSRHNTRRSDPRARRLH
jgi:hypothetical protein